MKIKIIEHGCPADKLPNRAHANDVGADVYALENYTIGIGGTAAIPLGFGLDLPAGFGAFIYPRSSQAKRGIDVKLPPLDPGYTRQMHAIIYNGGRKAYRIQPGDRIGQLVILPCVIPEFVLDMGDARGEGSFGSTGK